MIEKYIPKNIVSKKSRDVKHLHPKVALIATNFLKEVNEFNKDKLIEIKIISTLRSWGEQDYLYSKGRTLKRFKKVTNAPAGQSIHNWGCAFDLGVFKYGVYLDAIEVKEATDIYKSIEHIADKHKLVWGGNFNSFKDYPHYQFTGKYSNSEFLKKANAGIDLDELLK